MNRRITKIFVGVLLISGVFFSFGFLRNDNRSFEIVKNLDIFYSLFRELNLFYVDETDPEDLIETGINSMLSSLDPYTTFIPESEMDDFQFMTTGEYGGIGALIRKQGEYTIIADPYENSASAKAGIKAGDIIISVDGVSAKGKTLSEISEKLKGKPGTKLKLVLKKPGVDETVKINVIREQIRIDNVTYSSVLSDNTGYIRLSNFKFGAGEEVKEAFLKLKQKGIDRLILDLRENPGGLLLEAVRVCNLFIDKGQLIVSTKGKVSQWDKDYMTTQDPIDTGIPLIVMVSRMSASASEIVAGAVQDLDRGVVVGERTFGKGLVQTTRALKYNTQLKVTTAKYYIPSGRCIQALDYANRDENGSVGIVPDSLISEFKTKNGRTVFDGGGVYPDLSIASERFTNLSVQLYAQNMIFDFATLYVTENPELPNPNTFSLTDADYESFIAFVEDREFNFKTNSEKALEKLISEAKREKYYDQASAEIEDLREMLVHDNKKDLIRNKSEVLKLINEEIMGRYYYQKGRISQSIKYDHQIEVALHTISNNEKYNTILTKGSID